MEKMETKDLTHWPPFLSVCSVMHKEKKEKARAPAGRTVLSLDFSPRHFRPNWGPAGDISETLSLRVFHQELEAMLCLLLAPFLVFCLISFSAFDFFPAFAGCSFCSWFPCACVLQSSHLGIPRVGQLLPKEQQILELTCPNSNLDSEPYWAG